MSKCFIISPTDKKDSKLFDTLMTIAKGDEALVEEYYAYLLSSDFLTDFGNWVKDHNEYGFENRILANGEPNIFYDKDLKGYFYYNKYNTLTPFPPNYKGLNEYFSINEINDMVNVIAYNAYKEHFGEDFNTLDIFNTNFNLTTTVRKFLHDKLEETGNPDISILQKYEDELVKKVKEVYRRIGLIYRQDREIFEEDTAKETKKELVPKPSYERNSKDNVTTNVKLKLSFLPSQERDDVFYEKKFNNFDTVYKFLQNQLSDLYAKEGEDIYNIMFNKIVDLAKKKPYLNRLIELLNSSSENEKTEFVQAFNMSKINFLVSEIKPVENGKQITFMNVSDVGSKYNILLNEWNLNFKDLFSKETNKNKLKNIFDGLKEVKTQQQLHSVLKEIGINISEDALYLYLEDHNIKEAILNTKRLVNDLINNKINNKSLNTQAIVRDLAKAEAFYFDDASENTVYTGDKNRWVFSNPSYIDNIINSFKADIKNVEKLYHLPDNYQSSKVLEYLLALDKEFISDEARLEEAKKRINNIKSYIFNVFQEENKAGDSDDNENISLRDTIVDVINKSLQFKIGKENILSTPTPADKSTKRELSLGYFVDTKLRVLDHKIELDNQIYNIFYNYFKSEYERMIRAFKDIQEGNTLYTYYHTDENGNTHDENGKLLGNAFNSQFFPSLSNNTENLIIYNEDGSPLLNNLDVVKEDIIKIIKYNLENLIRRNNVALLRVSNNNLQTIIDNDILKAYPEQDRDLSITADITINNLINQIEFSKIFSGNLAYYKNLSDYKKRVPGTYTDGLYLRVSKPNEKYFNVTAVKDIILEASDFDNLTKTIKDPRILKQYKNINSADAQAWITPERWRFIVEKLGKWTDKHTSLYNKIIGVDESPITPEEFRFATQPLKGVYFDINNGVPTYLKYSQAVLIPKFIKGTKLEDLYNKMIADEKGNTLPFEKQIHEVVTLSGFKTGSITPSNIEDKVLKKQPLKNSGWKLQQDLPTKGFKDIKVGKQIQKVIFSALAYKLNDSFNVEGKSMTGLDLFKEIHKVTGDLSNYGVDDLVRVLGIDNNNQITNEHSFYKLLIEELQRRGDDENLIKGLEKGLSPYALPQASMKLINTFFSIVNKKTVDIETNGGSFIQISNYGLSNKDINNSGIKWFIDPKEGLKRPKMDLEAKTVTPGQILLPASYISKYIPNWEQLTGKEILNKLDPRILENIIGYRIPNQGLSSNDALEVVGIIPESMGDSIVAYTEIPTKTGSDFDIDKMYLMVPHFELNEDTGRIEYIKYDQNNPTKKSTENRLIELYKSVLLDPKSFKEVMTPIDFDFFKDYIKELFPERKSSNLEEFDIFNQIKTKFDFLGGKSGVGQTANSLMDHIRGMFVNSTLNNYNIGWGHSQDGETILDREYSEEEDGTKYKIIHSISALLNAYVDIAKDPYITRGNWNTLTANAGFLMLRAGIHPNKVNAFLGQPIIKEYVKAVYNNESKSGQRISNKRIIKKVKNIFGGKILDPYFVVSDMTIKDLEAEIKNPSNNQIKILDKFLEIQNFSKKLRDSMVASRVDTDGVGKNLGTRLIAENNIRKILSDIQEDVTGSINGFEDKFHSSLTGEDTLLGSYYKNSVDFLGEILKANPRLFLLAQNGIEDVFNQISKELGKGLLDNEKLAYKLETSYYSYLMSGFKPLQNENIKSLFTELADEVVKHKLNTDNFFLQQLELKEQEGYKFITLNNRFKPKSFKDNMYEGWKELMEDNPELADKLIQYAYYQSGFSPNLNSIYSYIPHEWFVIKQLDNYIIEQSFNNDNTAQFNFKDQFYRHNWDDRLIVPEVYNIESAAPSIGFVTDANPIGPSPEFVLYKNSLYKLEGYNKKDRPIYFKTYKLGYNNKGNKIVEYDYNKNVEKSIIDSNNINQEVINESIEMSNITNKRYPYPQIEEPTLEDFLNPKDLKHSKDRINKLFNSLFNNSNKSNDNISQIIPEKIISGGQTGVDISGLDAALDLGISIGGTAAANYTQSSAKNKKFRNEELKTKYNLKEGKYTQRTGIYGPYQDVYYQRTIDNAQEADGTIWFGNENSPGGKLTLGKVAQKNKPSPLINPSSKTEVWKWMKDNNIKIINIAGNREHTNPGIYQKTKDFLIETFQKEHPITIKNSDIEKSLRRNGSNQIYEQIFNSSQEDTDSVKVLEKLKDFVNKDSDLYQLLDKLSVVPFKVVWDDYSLTSDNTYMFITGDTIHLNLERIKNFPIKTFLQGFLHEVIHGYTINLYYKNNNFRKQIDKIFNDSKKKAFNKDFYGYTNSREFISEIITDPDFAHEIKTQNKSLFYKILNELYSWLFGKPLKTNEISDNYTKATSLIDEIILNQNNDYIEKNNKNNNESNGDDKIPDCI